VAGIVFLVSLAITLGTVALRYRLGPVYWWGLGVPFVAYVLLGLVTLEKPPKAPAG
jgi:hypothetical protein